MTSAVRAESGGFLTHIRKPAGPAVIGGFCRQPNVYDQPYCLRGGFQLLLHKSIVTKENSLEGLINNPLHFLTVFKVTTGEGVQTKHNT